MKNAPLRSDPCERLYSLDALRGFDMFWITGGGLVATYIAQFTWLDPAGRSDAPCQMGRIPLL